jgi:hypothetical protein
VLCDRKPGRQLELRGSDIGHKDHKRDSGSADDHILHQRSVVGRLQEQLHGGRFRFERTGGGLYQFRFVQQLGRDLYDDQRHGIVLGDR